MLYGIVLPKAEKLRLAHIAPPEQSLNLSEKLLGEYHKNETLKQLSLLYKYFSLLGHLQELQETEKIQHFYRTYARVI